MVLWVGEESSLWEGVFLFCYSLGVEQDLIPFLVWEYCGNQELRRRFFAVFTADSTLPLALLFPGELVLCSKCQSFVNLRNSDNMN